MMKQEFERIAGYEVEEKTYTEIIEPMYNATTLSKADFVKVLNRAALEKVAEKKKNIKKMLVRNADAFRRELIARRVKYETSGCGNLTHFEVYADDDEINALNNILSGM